MGSIFIGYRHDDGGYAWSIYQYLSFWFDEKDLFFDNERLASGEKYKPALTKAIEDSSVFLAVIGKQWLSAYNLTRLAEEDDITRGEIRTALNSGIPIILVPCGQGRVPLHNELPDDIARMRDFHAHPIPDGEHVPALNRLLDQLRDKHGLKPRYRAPHGVSQACHLGDQRLSEHFTDPVNALGRLRRLLADEGTAAVVGQATLQGMGGVGKTQLALKYSETYKEQYAGVWWFKSETLVQLEQDCQYFCVANGVSIQEGEEPHKAARQWLQRQPRWLLVFDNAEAEYGEKKEYLRPNLPVGDHHLIITARSPELGGSAATIPLDVWSEDQALPFLRKLLDNAGEEELRRLTRTLDGLPLALEQACAYLKKTGNPISAYCAAIDDLDRNKGYLDRQAAKENGYPYSVLATLSLAFDKLSDAAKEMLRLRFNR